MCHPCRFNKTYLSFTELPVAAFEDIVANGFCAADISWGQRLIWINDRIPPNINIRLAVISFPGLTAYPAARHNSSWKIALP